MYGLRKPFDVVTFTGVKFLGTQIDLKTACVLGQILGYMVSKYVGAKLCAEVARGKRAVILAAAGVWAQLALLAFAVLPDALKPLAMFANGLPLGVVWGLVVRYLEGRRLSDLLLVMLSGSFIIAGAATKDAALQAANWNVSEAWLPALTGTVFLTPYLLSILLLDQLPQPTERDEAARTVRSNLDARGRREFLVRVGAGFVLLILAYFLLTAYRDFRDYYGREILQAMGQPAYPGIFLETDRWALVVALCTLGLLTFIGSHRRALVVIYSLILAGFAVIAGATVAYKGGNIGGAAWLSMVGVGLYLAYVPFGTVLFERIVAAARFPGTSVFAVQLADGISYTGSVILQLYRDLAYADVDRLAFFVPLSYVVAIGGATLTLAGAVAVGRRLR
ncbi:MAG: DUF5690 family protein [Planctomycetes bacterium]|nr:DUF5690 family protein [Planctomycetota bacterium]